MYIHRTENIYNMTMVREEMVLRTIMRGIEKVHLVLLFTFSDEQEGIQLN